MELEGRLPFLGELFEPTLLLPLIANGMESLELPILVARGGDGELGGLGRVRGGGASQDLGLVLGREGLGGIQLLGVEGRRLRGGLFVGLGEELLIGEGRGGVVTRLDVVHRGEISFLRGQVGGLVGGRKRRRHDRGVGGLALGRGHLRRRGLVGSHLTLKRGERGLGIRIRRGLLR